MRPQGVFPLTLGYCIQMSLREDFAAPVAKVAVSVSGSASTHGTHSTSQIAVSEIVAASASVTRVASLSHSNGPDTGTRIRTSYRVTARPPTKRRTRG